MFYGYARKGKMDAFRFLRRLLFTRFRHYHGHLHELLVGGGAGAGVTFKGRATWSFTAVLVSTTAEVKAVKTRLTSHEHIFMG